MLRSMCLPQPRLEVQTTNEVCFNDHNGIINVTNPDPNYLYKLNNLSPTTETSFDSLRPNTYTVYVKDVKNCQNQTDVTIQNGQRLTFNVFTLVCDNNGTASNDKDDTYKITFDVFSSTGNLGTYTLFIDGVPNGPYNYATSYILTVLADNSLKTSL